MATNVMDFIERKVDQLFTAQNARHGERCHNPVTGLEFVWGIDPITPQKQEAVRALHAGLWFEENGPANAPRLPLSDGNMEEYRNAGGLTALVGFYKRSLAREGDDRNSFDFQNHPSFSVFASGLMHMAVTGGLWGLENDTQLIGRFPPRPLEGMTPGAYWAPPEEYKATIASYGPWRSAA